MTPGSNHVWARVGAGIAAWLHTQVLLSAVGTHGGPAYRLQMPLPPHTRMHTPSPLFRMVLSTARALSLLAAAVGTASAGAAIGTEVTITGILIDNLCIDQWWKDVPRPAGQRGGRMPRVWKDGGTGGKRNGEWRWLL